MSHFGQCNLLLCLNWGCRFYDATMPRQANSCWNEKAITDDLGGSLKRFQVRPGVLDCAPLTYKKTLLVLFWALAA